MVVGSAFAIGSDVNAAPAVNQTAAVQVSTDSKATGAVSPTLGEWVELFGEPSRSIEDSNNSRTDNEPLLVYWMRTKAAPLGMGPSLPGTLVANFVGEATSSKAVVGEFTFLAMGNAQQLGDLENALQSSDCIKAETMVERRGGQFRELSLACPDGKTGVLSIRGEGGPKAWPDGRPAPSLWMHVTFPVAPTP